MEAQVNKKYKWQKYSKEELKHFALSSSSLKNFSEKIGYAAYRTNIKTQILKEYPDLKEIIDFLSHGGQNLISLKFGLLEVLSFNPEESKRQHHRCWNCKCSCGRITVVRGNRLLNKEIESCLNCSKRENLTKQRFGKITVLNINEELTAKNNDRRAVWDCICDCGSFFSATTHELKQGKDSCGCNSKSKGEKIIEQIFIDNKINYKNQYSFKNLKNKRKLKFDFAIFNSGNQLKCLIEYQGKQHYEPVEFFGGNENFHMQQELDQKKRNFCKDNNIKLIEIPYWDFDKINLNYLKIKIGDNL